MKGIEVARKVVAEKSLYMFRPKKDSPGEYDAKPWSGNKRGWTYLDLFSASIYVRGYDAQPDAIKAKLDAMHLTRAVLLVMKASNQQTA